MGAFTVSLTHTYFHSFIHSSQHVGMAKCTVACEVAKDMVPVVSEEDGNSSLPSIMYQAHHGNVCDTSKFNVAFVKEFDLVLNALDNVEARRRVNRLCLAADVPLVEAGTTGYLGQVTVIHKSSDVACYECNTQETQKVYPICTIRSTPSMPVHTIVWAKELYKLVAHSKVEESMLYEDPEGEEPSTYMESVTTLRGLLQSATPVPDEDLHSAIGVLLQALYITEIQKQLDMGRYKAAKKTPTVLGDTIFQEGLKDTSDCSSTTDVWSLQQCVAQTVRCLHQMANAAEQEQVVLEEFDKDDDLAMRFVTATSNLRSHIFGIEPLQSYYTAKGIAGNIVSRFVRCSSSSNLRYWLMVPTHPPFPLVLHTDSRHCHDQCHLRRIANPTSFFHTKGTAGTQRCSATTKSPRFVLLYQLYSQ